MARQTWTTLKARLKVIMRSRDDSDTYLETWLRQRYDEIVSSYRFYEFDGTTTITLLNNTSTKSISGITDLKYIISLRSVSNRRRVKKVSFRTIDNRDVSSKGIPTQYARYGSDLLFDMTANADTNYTLRYKKLITEPNFSSGTPETPAQWDDVILYGAAVKGYHELFEPERAEFYQLKETRLIAELPSPDSVEEEDAEPALLVKS